MEGKLAKATGKNCVCGYLLIESLQMVHRFARDSLATLQRDKINKILRLFPYQESHPVISIRMKVTYTHTSFSIFPLFYVISIPLHVSSCQTRVMTSE